ncbi:MAG TPA: hypothetical protein VG167_11170 [Verrucomicrobiae bacterium]|nr:hypothetical protein [Verrucomicrobiae bacterium]
MSGHEVFLAKLAEIGREYEERLRPEQMVQSRLPICPHCGWAALVLVRVIPPQRFGPGLALTDTS